MTARSFALIFGLFWLGFAVLSMMPGIVVPLAGGPPTRFDVMYGALAGLFPVNLLLTLVHFAVGGWGLAAFLGGITNSLQARAYARGCAFLFAALGLMGLVDGLDTVFGLMPLHGGNVWLHLAAAAFAAFVGWKPQTRERRVLAQRRRGPADRRQAPRASAGNERRQGLPDRRRAPYAA